MLKIEKLSKVFSPGTADEHIALHNINLEINNGDFVTVIGSNGAGKSTLFNMVSGTLRPSTGSIFLEDNEISKWPEYKRSAHIGRIFQNPTLGTSANMALEDNLIIASTKGAKGLKVSLNDKKRVEFSKQLKRLDMNLENRLKENVGLFSGGQRQAITLLMMVLSKPKLVLLDEHTAALDPRNAAKILDLTKAFVSELNLTCVMITHNMQHAIDFGNRLLMMDQGKIIFEAHGEEKKKLTVDGLVQRFHDLTHRDMAQDNVLLSD